MRPAALQVRRLPRSVAETTGYVLVIAIAAVAFCLPVFSQTAQGTLEGSVFDQSGGAIAGATVTVIDVARGVTRTLITDSAGQYVETNAIPGTYTVRAEAKGFQTVEHSGVLIEVGQNIRVDLVLRPGEQTQTVTVTGEIPSVDTTDATLGGTVSNQSINALPLNGRNFDRLLQLRPGIITSPGATTGASATNGRRSIDDLLLVDGIAQIDQTAATGTGIMQVAYRGGDTSSLMPIDAIQEFNTEQNPKAEYGWKDGSVINVGMKSGTNGLHGTAYAFGRDASATDAANYFTGLVTPASLEQFGATAGGPIIKDKLFWFVSYEGLRVNLGDVTVDTIPSDISVGNSTKSIVDACNLVGRANVNALSAELAGLPAGSCTPLPSSSTFENLFPYNPNASNNFAPGLISDQPENNALIKGDWALSPHHHLAGMWYVSKASQVSNAAASELEPQWLEDVGLNAQMYDGSWTWTPNSTWVNDARMGYVYLADKNFYADSNLFPANPWPNGYGMPTGVTNPTDGGLPTINITGFTGELGANSRTGFKGPEGNLDFVDSVSYLRGKQAFKFGFEYLDAIVDQAELSFTQGSVTFASLQTFLQGTPSSGSILVGDPTEYLRSHWFSGFAQDDWRLTPKITVNLGLRYQYQTPPTERSNYLGTFNPNVNPATTPAVQQVGPGEPIASLYHPEHTDFSPRLGVAWDVKGNGKTVVRAGASVMRLAALLLNVAYQAPFGANYPSLGINTSGTAVNIHTPALFGLSSTQFNWNLTGPVFPVAASQVINGVTYDGLTCSVALPCPTGMTNPNFEEPGVVNWNVDIQRAVTNSLSVDVAYVGNHGYKEYYSQDVNQPAIGTGWNTPWTAAQLTAVKQSTADAGLTSAQMCLGQGPSPFCSVNTAAELGPYSANFPYLNYIMQATNGEISNYDGLQVSVNARTFHALTFLSAYTFSHSLDESSSNGQGGGILPSDNSNLRLLYGPGTYDIRHSFTLSPTYAIPGTKSPGQMLQGWLLSGIVTLQSGTPWFPTDGTTDDFLGTGENRNSVSSNSPGVTQYWNYSGPTSAFTAGPTPIPCYGKLAGCTSFASAPAATTAACQTAAQAPYAGNAQLQALALASLANFGCYVQNGGILTPPAYGTVGNSGRDVFRNRPYYNVDFSVAKVWNFKERYSVQFRAEFFNLFNRLDYASATANPAGGFTGHFGCSCSTPDSANAVLGSGGPRHVQFGLKLTY